MRILITNWTMIGHGGTQVFTAMLAKGMQARGHEVYVFSPRLGPFSKRLAESGVRVVDRLDADAPEPDVIHGHQGREMSAALVRFPEAAGVFVCRSGGWWYDVPPLNPRIVRWIGVDEVCRDWLLRHAAPVIRSVEIVPNRIDLAEFPQRPPLPERPLRALVFVNHPRHVETITEACRQCRLDLDGLGSGFGLLAWDPGAVLERYSIVFTSARKALESLCVGNAVIATDERGLAGMVTSANFPEFRRHNFAERILTRPVSVDAILEEIGRYDPREAARVSALARADAGIEKSIDRFEALYREAILELAARRDEIKAQERVVFPQYLLRWMPDPVSVAAPAAAELLTPDDKRSAEADRMVTNFMLPPNYPPREAVIRLHRR